MRKFRIKSKLISGLFKDDVVFYCLQQKYNIFGWSFWYTIGTYEYLSTAERILTDLELGNP